MGEGGRGGRGGRGRKGRRGHPPPTNYQYIRPESRKECPKMAILIRHYSFLAGSFNTPWGPKGDQKRRNPRNGIRKIWLKIKNPKSGLDYEETPTLILQFRPILHCPYTTLPLGPAQGLSSFSNVCCTFGPFFIVLGSHALGPSAFSFLMFECWSS